MTSDEIFADVRRWLEAYAFRVNNESELQAQVTEVLESHAGDLRIQREVIAERGRYDILVERTVQGETQRVVLELKVTGIAEAVERQAQRYALTNGIDAVAVVTTSQRLARQITQGGSSMLGGKPFTVISLRTTF